jgi:hypothetical protein
VERENWYVKSKPIGSYMFLNLSPGKWVKTVEAFFCLTKSPEWSEVTIEPFEKLVIRRVLWSQVSWTEIAKDNSSGNTIDNILI